MNTKKLPETSRGVSSWTDKEDEIIVLIESTTVLSQQLIDMPKTEQQWAISLQIAARNELMNGNLDKALELLLDATNLDIKIASIFEDIALIYVQKNEISLAFKYFNQAITIDPLASNALCNAWSVAWKIGDLPLAIEYLKKAIELFPNDPYNYLTLWQVYDVMDDLGSAMRCYGTVLEICSEDNYVNNDSSIYFALWMAFLDRHYYEPAVNMFLNANEIDPTNTEYIRYLRLAQKWLNEN